MVRVVFALLSIIADYETVTTLAQLAFRLGLLSVSIFACAGVLCAIWRKSQAARF